MKKTSKPRTRAAVPQANDLDLVIEAALAVASGEVKTTDELADRLHYVPRLGHYYAEAADELGLIERGEDGGLRPTSLIRRVIESSPDTQAALLSYGIQHLRVLRGVQRRVRATGTITIRDIEAAIARLGYSGETVTRRRSCVVSWLRWLAGHGHYVVVHEERRGLPEFVLRV